MKKLFYCVSSLHHPHAGIVLDKMLSDRAKGFEVIMAYCNRALPSCITNKNGNLGICRLCRHMHHNIISQYLKDIRTIPISHKQYDPVEHKFEYNDISDLRHITYRDVHAGHSLLSYYITFTRKTEGAINDNQREYFDRLLSSLCAFIDYAYTLVDQIKPDIISIFNGRMFESRLFYEIAKAKDIKFESLEVSGGFNEPFYRVQFDGGLPHSISLRTQLINKLWQDTTHSDEEKRGIGTRFYEYRRNGIPAADRVYTGEQKADLLPDDYNPNIKNVVIFNSSEDEFAALGEEWEEDKIFESQKDTVEFVTDSLPTNTHVYLRIHPHLKGINAKYHTELYDLADKNNLTIIPPESPVSSYALLDIADTVVVMGSTMGVEACYWGKPVINLRKSFYDHLDVCYIPQNREEFKRLLNQDLAPKDKEGALKYGLYFMDRDETVEKENHINFNTYTSTFLGRKIGDVVEYLKICGSSTLYKVFSILFYKYGVKHFKNTISFPD